MEDGVSHEGFRAATKDGVRLLRNEIAALSEAQIGQILTQARSHCAWTDKPVSGDLPTKSLTS